MAAIQHTVTTANIYQLYVGSQKVLTLNVRGPSYLGLTKSILWLLMPWLRSHDTDYIEYVGPYLI